MSGIKSHSLWTMRLKTLPEQVLPEQENEQEELKWICRIIFIPPGARTMAITSATNNFERKADGGFCEVCAIYNLYTQDRKRQCHRLQNQQQRYHT
jgi:hypothetical protein